MAKPQDIVRISLNFMNFQGKGKKEQRVGLKARLLFRRETLFPGYTVQTKLTASLLKMCLEQPSKMINRANISHQGFDLQEHKQAIGTNGWQWAECRRLMGHSYSHIHLSSGPGNPTGEALGESPWDHSNSEKSLLYVIIKIFTWNELLSSDRLTVMMKPQGSKKLIRRFLHYMLSLALWPQILKCNVYVSQKRG